MITNSNHDSTTSPTTTLTPETAGWISLLMIVASMSVVTAKLIDAPVLRSANDRSRWCTVWSLVERGTYQIDEIRQKPGWDTIDLVRHNDHFYSSKPPLLPRLVAQVYLGVRSITGWTLTDHTAETTRTILFLINILPMGFALWFFSRTIQRYARDPWCHLFIMGCACWGMLLLPFLTVFNNHTVAATCFFISIPLAIQILVENKESLFRYFSCGLITAFGICNELPAALLGIGLFAILMKHSVRKTLFVFVPAACIPIAGFLVTNYQVTGGILPFYAKYGTETYEYVYEGVPSYWMEPRGIDLPRDSTATYLFHCTLGHHGILSLSPIFLLTLATWCCPPLWVRSRLRAFHWLGLGLTCSTLIFYLTKTANYNYGGVSVALRWMLWLTPFWLLSMLPILSYFNRQLWFRAVTLILLSVSVFSAWYPANSPWTQNWIFRLMTRAKWINYSDPHPQFHHKHYTWIGALPDGPLQPDYTMSYQAVHANGQQERITLSDGGPTESGLRLIIFSRTRNGPASSEEIGYLLDVAKFRNEKPVEEFLIKRQNDQPITEDDFNLFRGMPRRMQYISSRVRYVKTDLRRDAFRCQIGYTYVQKKGEGGRSLRQIRDIWYSEEVPFGVLKWEDRVEETGSRKVLSRQLWQPVAAGKFLKRTPQPEF